MLPKGVLFDFDGVLIDSLDQHLYAWELAFSHIFKTNISTDTRSELKGKSTQSIAEHLCSLAGKPEEKNRLIVKKSEFLNSRITHISLLPGAREAITLLKKLNIPFGIASNAPKVFIGLCLKQLHLDIPCFFGIEDYRTPKPSPEPYLTCARALCISISDHKWTYVFEDSLHGLKSACLAKMIAIGVATQHDKATLTNQGAQFVCSNLSEVLEKGWFESIP